MARKLVVFARDDDLHADAVLCYCSGAGIEIIRLDVRDVIGGGISLSFEFEAEARRTAIRSGKRLLTDSDDVVVLCREFAFPPVSSIEDVNLCVAFEETRSALDGWAHGIPRNRWVDHPVVQTEMDNKPLQIRIAQQCGLLIPKTLITNEPDLAKAFSADRPTVIKQLSNLSFVGINQTNECIYTSPVDQTSLVYADEIRSCPVLLQERVDKIADVRITVVGENVFPAKIISSSSDQNVVDFRARNEEAIEKISIPDGLRQAVIKMTKRMSVRFAAFDFGLTEAGEYIFFEANVVGNWLWIEKDTGLPISKSLADLLLGIT